MIVSTKVEHRLNAGLVNLRQFQCSLLSNVHSRFRFTWIYYYE